MYKVIWIFLKYEIEEKKAAWGAGRISQK